MSTYQLPELINVYVVCAHENKVKLFLKSKINFHAYYFACIEDKPFKYNEIITATELACQPIHLQDN